MTSAYTWSKTAGSNATADSGINWAEGMLPSAVNDSARVMMARFAAWRDDHGAIALSGSNTITVATNSVLSLATGREIIAKVGTTNTGAATLNANSLGAKAVKKISSAGEADVAAGDLKAGALAHLVYDAAANSSSGAWILLNPTVPVVGVDAQAYDAELAAIAGLTSAADKVPYFTGSGTAAVTDFTASGRDLVAQDIDTDQYVYGDGTGSWAVGTLTSAGRALLDDANAAAQRATLGVKANSEKACFSAHKNGSDQSITGGSPVKATFGTELFDVGSYYDTSTSRWTPPAGKHVINASVDYEAATDNQIVAVYLYKNGSPFRWKVHRAAGTGSQSASLTALVDANGTDYYEVYALNFASTNIQGETTFTFFEGWEL